MSVVPSQLPTVGLRPSQPGAPPREPAETREQRRERQAAARAARASARAAARAIVPLRSEDFAALSLDQLRAYRRALLEEEDRVSYWRRILQARLDTLREGGRPSRGDLAALAPVLTAPRVQRGRSALVTVVAADDIPPLPDLARLWEQPHVPGDLAGTAALEEGLVGAEAELSAYRSALHRRLDAATMELIARYREDPARCLEVLPLQQR